MKTIQVFELKTTFDTEDKDIISLDLTQKPDNIDTNTWVELINNGILIVKELTTTIQIIKKQQ